MSNKTRTLIMVVTLFVSVTVGCLFSVSAPTLAQIENVGCATPRDTVNIREKGENSKVMGQLPWGAIVKVYGLPGVINLRVGYPVSSEAFWQPITYEGVKGYVRGDLLTVVECPEGFLPTATPTATPIQVTLPEFIPEPNVMLTEYITFGEFETWVDEYSNQSVTLAQDYAYLGDDAAQLVAHQYGSIGTVGDLMDERYPVSGRNADQFAATTAHGAQIYCAEKYGTRLPFYAEIKPNDEPTQFIIMEWVADMELVEGQGYNFWHYSFDWDVNGQKGLHNYSAAIFSGFRCVLPEQ